MVLTQPTQKFCWRDDDYISFHTTMVLTQHASAHNVWMQETTVSIPLWFSRNPNNADIKAMGKV